MKTFFDHSHMTYILHPVAFIKLLIKFKPDPIHIEEDPHSLVAVETVFLASFLCPAARITFFIWDNLNRAGRFPLNLLKRWLTRYSLSHAAGVVAGNLEAQQLLISGKNYNGPTAVLAQFGIDCEKYQGSAKPEIAERIAKQTGIPVIGFMGRLIPEKGILLLCQALEELKHLPWKLVIVAAGPLENELQSRWKPGFGDRLLLLGPGARADLPDYLKCMDILVVPSMSAPHWKEQFGYILVEAMASGVAVIGSSSGAIPEVIGEAGVIFPEGDVAQLKKSLIHLLQSEDERRRYSLLGRERARSTYSHEVISAAHSDLFHRFGSH